MSRFIIQGSAQLHGRIVVNGSKNAALPLLAATLLTDEPCDLSNIPAIADVTALQTLITTARAGQTLSDEQVGRLRGSILLLGALLGRQRHVRLPRPGGDIIGARPIDVHLDGLAQLGAGIKETNDEVIIDGAGLTPGRVILREFSVTATENIMLAAATLPGTTIIAIAAAEPHVAALAHLLTAMGALVEGGGTHTITIHGQPKLRGASFVNIPDMLEAGFFILLAAGTHSPLTVSNVPIDDLLLFFKKLDDIGINYAIEGDTVIVSPSKLKAFKMQSLPHPGIATDLQAYFSVIATQASGSSLIHDPLYEGRFKHIAELQKMGAHAIVCDPHRVIINGPTKLRGRSIPSLDIRAGATLLMAGLVAEGETVIEEAEIIDRGYADLTPRLQQIGANIRREGNS